MNHHEYDQELNEIKIKIDNQQGKNNKIHLKILMKISIIYYQY